MRYLVGDYQVANYENISIKEAIRRVKSWPYVCLDIETKGDLKYIHSHKPTLLQVGYKDDVIIIDSPKDVSFLKNKKLVGHNIKFDLSVLSNYFNFKCKELFDTMLAAQILECGLLAPKEHFTLASVTRRYTENKYAYTEQGSLFDEVVTKKIRKTFLTSDSPFSKAQLDYASQDVENVQRLYLVLKKLLEENDLTKTADLEFRFCKLLVDIELKGIYLDQHKWLSVAEEVLEKLNESIDALEKIQDINWNSWQQVLVVFKELGVNVQIFDKKTGEIKESVSRAVIASQENKFPEVKLYLTYKKLAKLYGTYGPSFIKHVSPYTSRVHTSIFQILSTGRTGSSSPNLQNIVRGSSYREAFRAEEGNTLIVADYSSQEIHVAADLAEEKTLIQFLKDRKDPHLETARLVFANPNLTKESEERQIAKSIGFLMLYGGGPTKLANNYNISIAQAKKTIELYFNTYKDFSKMFEEGGEAAERLGYILHDKKFKRRSYLYFYDKMMFAKAHVERFKAMGWEPHPVIEDIYRKYRAELQRYSQNYRVQGLSATMSKLAGLLIQERLGDMGHLVLLVHDEWVAEVKNEFKDVCKKIIEEGMIEASKIVLKHLDIPASPKITPTWSK